MFTLLQVLAALTSASILLPYELTVRSERSSPAGRPQLLAASQDGNRSAEREKDLRKAAEDGDIERMRSLLAAGVSPDAADGRKRTALMLAAERGHLSAVELLLEHGADVALLDADGETAIYKARRRKRNSVIARFEAHVAALREQTRLREEEERRVALQATAEYNAGRIELLKRYEVGRTTFEQFQNDGWESPEALTGTFFQRIGLVELVKKGSILNFTIGTYDFSKTTISQAGDAERSLAAVFLVRTALSNYAHLKKRDAGNFIGSDRRTIVPTCTVKFDHGVLTSISFTKLQ